MTLDDLLASAVPAVSTAAQRVQNAYVQWHDGMITEAEYSDLVADATALDRVDADMRGALTREELQELFQALVAIAGALPKP